MVCQECGRREARAAGAPASPLGKAGSSRPPPPTGAPFSLSLLVTPALPSHPQITQHHLQHGLGPQKFPSTDFCLPKGVKKHHSRNLENQVPSISEGRLPLVRLGQERGSHPRSVVSRLTDLFQPKEHLGGVWTESAQLSAILTGPAKHPTGSTSHQSEEPSSKRICKQ